VNIIEISSGKKYLIEITQVEDIDFRFIRKNRFFFNWKTEREYEVYKLQIVGTNEILGLISLVRIPQEWRVHIRLLTVSKENQGKNKRYEKIAGNLLTFAAKLALSDYSELACVSLRPKSQIAKHYIEKYNMRLTGMTLSIQIPEILDLIKYYDND